MSLRKSLIVLLSFLALFFALMGVFSLSSNGRVTYATEIDETNDNNNAYTTAMQFNYNDSVKGKLNSANDIDWYKFKLDERGRFYVDFRHDTVYENNYVQWSVSVYKGMNYDAFMGVFTDVYLLGEYEVYGRKGITTAEFGVHEGTYFIKVEKGLNNTGSYVDKNYFIYTTFMACDNWEGERNDEKGHSEFITVNKEINGAITTEMDEDWFEFRTTTSGVFYVDFKHDKTTTDLTQNKYWNMYIYDKDGNFIDGYENKYYFFGGYDGKTSNFGVEPGKYFVKITKGDDGFLQKHYTLKVCFTETDAWETESNNVKSKADNITVNNAVSGAITSQKDNDWYTFTTTEKGYFYIDFKHDLGMNSSVYWRIYVLDSEGNAVDGITDGCNLVSYDTNEVTGSYGVEAGTYYVRVTAAFGYVSCDYNLTVCFNASNNFETELNNKMDDADLTELNKTINACLTIKGDVDWFTFDVQNDTKVQVFFDHQMISQEKECWTCILYNDKLDILYKASFSGNSEKSVSDYIDLSVGKYYFKIIEADKGELSNATYSITTIEYHDHVGEWVITNPPTCTETGIETNTCTICGHQETRDVDALGHDYQKHVATESKLFKFGEIEYICSRCGDKYSEKDKSKLWLTVTVIAFAISTVGGGIYAIVAAAKGKNIFK